MQRRSSRRRIIDSTSVPNNRRKERHISIINANKDCVTKINALADTVMDNDGKSGGHPIPNYSKTRNPLFEELTDGINSDNELRFTENYIRNKPVSESSSNLSNEIQKTEHLSDSDESDVFESESDSDEDSDTDRDVDSKSEQECSVSLNDTETIVSDTVCAKFKTIDDGCINTNLKSYPTESAIDKCSTKETTSYMFPSRTAKHPCLFPAIPEEIHRELVKKEFMLPWRSMDMDETYTIVKPRPRRNIVKDIEKDNAIDNTSHADNNRHDNGYIGNDFREPIIHRACDRKDSFSLELDEKIETTERDHIECNFEKTNVLGGLESKDPFSIELEKTRSFQDTQGEFSGCMQDLFGRLERRTVDSPLLDTISMHMEVFLDSEEEDGTDETWMQEIARQRQDDPIEEDAYSGLMDGADGSPRLLSVEEKWQIIFNEKTRAPIYAVGQYIDYLTQYVNGKSAAVKDKDRINPISYLLRKLKLDLKMSYDSFVEEFLKPGNNGMALLVKLLKSIQNAGTQQTGSANKAQLKNYKKTLTDEHDCLLCIKFALKIKTALSNLMEINYGLETIAMSLLSSFTKSRGTAIEILTITLSAAEGFSRTLDSFTYIQLKIGEPVRFKSLVNMLNMDSQHNIIFKVSCMKFMNSLLDAATNLNVRVYLQHELETAGMDVTDMLQRTTGTGLEYDDLRHELTEWTRKYVRVDEIISQKNVLAQKVEIQNQTVIDELQRSMKVLTLEKTTLEHQLENTRTILKKANEELQRRIPSTDHGVQVNMMSANLKDVSCQCSEQDDSERNRNPIFNYQLTEAWQNSTSYPDDDVTVSFDYRAEVEAIDEHGVVKVQHWLESQSDGPVRKHTITQLPHRKTSVGASSGHKTEFPGNWKLVPKSIVQFPSRFPVHQCHQTNCDRCDIRNRPENVPIVKKQDVVSHSQAYTLKQNTVSMDKKRHEVKSESSDSAIGGSGERWQTKDSRIALLPADVTEAEILQDMIEPDDSASGCRENEPFPDYSVVSAKINHRKSFRSELSEVLREFEGSLNQYDTPNLSNMDNGYTGHFVTLGQV